MVVNGTEIGSESIRIHDRTLQSLNIQTLQALLLKEAPQKQFVLMDAIWVYFHGWYCFWF